MAPWIYSRSYYDSNSFDHPTCCGDIESILSRFRYSIKLARRLLHRVCSILYTYFVATRYRILAKRLSWPRARIYSRPFHDRSSPPFLLLLRTRKKRQVKSIDTNRAAFGPMRSCIRCAFFKILKKKKKKSAEKFLLKDETRENRLNAKQLYR